MTTAPLLSLLWESADPADALTKRFGFADAVSAVGWMGDALWDTWAIAVDDCDRLVISAGNLLAWITTDDRRLIAKWSVRPWLFRREMLSPMSANSSRSWSRPAPSMMRRMTFASQPVPSRHGVHCPQDLGRRSVAAR